MRAWFVAALLTFSLGGAACAPAGTACSPACSAADTCCDDGSGPTCAITTADPHNCGGCGITCMAGEVCSFGHCTRGGDGGVRPDAAVVGNCHPTCASGSMCCGATCVPITGVASGDGRADPSFANCRICGVGCDATNASRCGPPHGGTTPLCLCGDGNACGTGSVCEISGGSFTCINHMTDAMHCGTPSVACMPGEACVGGICTCNGADGGPDDAGASARCPAGLTCTTSGCIDLMTDEAHCGSLANACRVGETCTAGMCGCGVTTAGAAGMRCPPGGLGMCGQECCGNACIYVDDYNCGGCGTACVSPMLCVHGVFGGVPHCGAETGMLVACDAPTDAAVIPNDAAADGGVDAAVDASVDAYVDPG